MNNMVLGKHSGKHAFRNKIKEMGYEVSEEGLKSAFEQFKINHYIGFIIVF